MSLTPDADSDSGTADPTVSVQWLTSAALGHFADTAAPATTFTCEALGVTTLTLVVRNAAGCSASVNAELRCVPVNLCGNGQVDPEEPCDGKLGPDGALGPSLACAPDCTTLIDLCAQCRETYCVASKDPGLGPEACDRAFCSKVCLP